MDDRQLLSAYLSKSSTDAFAQIVRQNIDLVYSAARRQFGNSHLAEDVTQVVFLLLSRKAASVKGPLAGWLLTATHFAAHDARKLAARREYHERQAAFMRPERAGDSDEPLWETYAPILDDAMAELKASDRDAVALRYLRGFSLEQVGVALGINAKAAEKRVSRAVARLRATLAIKGAVPSVAVLATQLAARGSEAAPAKLAETIAFTGTSVAKGTLVSAIARKAGQAMYWTNAKIAAMVLAAVTVAGAGTGTFLIQWLQPSIPATPTGMPLTLPTSRPSGTSSWSGTYAIHLANGMEFKVDSIRLASSNSGPRWFPNGTLLSTPFPATQSAEHDLKPGTECVAACEIRLPAGEGFGYFSFEDATDKTPWFWRTKLNPSSARLFMNFCSESSSMARPTRPSTFPGLLVRGKRSRSSTALATAQASLIQMSK